MVNRFWERLWEMKSSLEVRAIGALLPCLIYREKEKDRNP
jgi:hypothetical protein